MSLIDEIVITDGNREAFETVLEITADHDEPVRMFVWGPVGSGKSTVLQARGREKDLLSKKGVMFCNAAELMLAVTLEDVSEDYLNKAGSIEVLLIDGFEDFFSKNGGEFGPELCRLLLGERNRLGLETVLFSNVALDEVDVSKLGDALDGYRIVAVELLDEAGRLEFAHKVMDSLRTDEAKPIVTDEGLEYIAGPFAQEVGDIRNALRYLIAVAGFEDGATITLDQVKEALHS